MGTISARLPDDLEAELEEFVEAENLERSTAVRKLLSEGLDEWRRDRALAALESGEMTLSRAAEYAGVSTWDLVALARKRDVSWVDDAGVAEDLESV